MPDEVRHGVDATTQEQGDGAIRVDLLHAVAIAVVDEAPRVGPIRNASQAVFGVERLRPGNAGSQRVGHVAIGVVL